MKTEQDIELTKLPKSAMPVVRYIRENVEREECSSRRSWDIWGVQIYVWLSQFGWKFPPAAYHALIKWWNSQTDPQAAVDAIWGKE